MRGDRAWHWWAIRLSGSLYSRGLVRAVRSQKEKDQQ